MNADDQAKLDTIKQRLSEKDEAVGGSNPPVESLRNKDAKIEVDGKTIPNPPTGRITPQSLREPKVPPTSKDLQRIVVNEINAWITKHIGCPYLLDSWLWLQRANVGQTWEQFYAQAESGLSDYGITHLWIRRNGEGHLHEAFVLPHDRTVHFAEHREYRLMQPSGISARIPEAEVCQIVLEPAMFEKILTQRIGEKMADKAIAKAKSMPEAVLSVNMIRSLRSPSGYKRPLGSGYESFTDRARKVMQLANQEVQRMNHEFVEPEHVLIGLLKEGSGIGAQILQKYADKINLRTVRDAMNPGEEKVTMGTMPQSMRTKLIVSGAIECARVLEHNYVGTEHLLMALTLRTQGNPLTDQLFDAAGLTMEKVRQEIENILAKCGQVPGKDVDLSAEEIALMITRIENVVGYKPQQNKIPQEEHKPMPPYSFREQSDDYSYEITFATLEELMAWVKLTMPQVFEKKE